MNFVELQTLLRRCVDIHNDRPLGVHISGGQDPEYRPITPNTLLKASRTASQGVQVDRFDTQPDSVMVRMKMVDTVFKQWWQRYMIDVFDSLVPYRKWQKSHPNLEVGDLCYLKYDQQLGPDVVRLCIVTQVFPDANGLVRTVEVAYRATDVREKGIKLTIKELTKVTVPVQRLYLVIAKKDQIPSVDARLHLFYVCDMEVWPCDQFLK